MIRFANVNTETREGIAAWLDANWLYAGVIAGCFYLALLPFIPDHWTHASLLLWLQLPIYIAHQVEEHYHDRFHRYVNEHLGAGHEILTSRAIVVINIGGVWCIDFLALYLAVFVRSGYGLLAFYLAIVNALIHLVTGAATRSYNPGLITAIFLLLPFGVWGAVVYSIAYKTSLEDHLICAFATVVLHIVIVAHVVRRKIRP